MDREYKNGHTGKISYDKESTARYIARHNKFGKNMRAYSCRVGGELHWHITTMSKVVFNYTQKKATKKP